MTVAGTDLRWFLSSSGASEGGARSATEIANAVDNNVFPDINDVDRLADGSVIRKVFLHNQNGVDVYLPHSFWIVRPPLNCTSYIGLGFDDADEDDTTAGTLTNVTGTGKIALISDGPDTRTVDVHGYDAAGDPLKESVVLTGATEVLTVGDFSALLACHTTISASRIITIKQGAGGTTRGTIPVGGVNCFRWLTATSKALGLKLVALPSGQANGIWERRDHAAGATAGDGNRFGIKAEKL